MPFCTISSNLSTGFEARFTNNCTVCTAEEMLCHPLGSQLVMFALSSTINIFEYVYKESHSDPSKKVVFWLQFYYTYYRYNVR